MYVEAAMKSNFGAYFVSLHVRKSNRAALALYKDNLQFKYVYRSRFLDVLTCNLCLHLDCMKWKRDIMLMERMRWR